MSHFVIRHCRAAASSFVIAAAAAAAAADPATNAVDLIEEDLAEPRYAILGIGGGIVDSRWAWPGEDVVVDGVVLAFGLSLFDTHNGVGLGLGAQWADESLNGVHLSLVQHDASAMRGLQIASAMRGVQIAGILNTGGRSEGLQIAGFANLIREGAGVQLSLLMNSNQILMPPRTDHYADYYERFDANEFAGVQIAPFGNVASCLEGVQIAGLINKSDGYHADGLQLALGMNVSRRMRGVQAALVGNKAEERLSGIQFGLFNLAEGELFGAQIGAMNATAETLRGVQAGLLNYAKDARGLQFGAVNLARHLEGVQIGLLNYAADAAVPCLPILNARF